MGPDGLAWGMTADEPSIRNIPRVGKTSAADAPAPATGHPPHALGNARNALHRAPIVKAANARARVRSGGSSRPRGRGTMDRTDSQHARHRRARTSRRRPGATRAIRASGWSPGSRLVAHRAHRADRRRCAPPPAFAADYPTWEEVQAREGQHRGRRRRGQADHRRSSPQLAANVAGDARSRPSVAPKSSSWRSRSTTTPCSARRRSRPQADASAAEAAEAERNAGQVAAQLYRSGGGDLGVNLFLEAGNSGSTDVLLVEARQHGARWSSAPSGIYDGRAGEAATPPSALSDQAAVARGEREELRIAAEAGARRRAGGAGRGRGGARRVAGEEDRARRSS